MSITIKIPTTVEMMADLIKGIADNYIADKLNYSQAYADFQFLMSRRKDLFDAALTVRWVGKKRLKLIQSILGDIQLNLL